MFVVAGALPGVRKKQKYIVDFTGHEKFRQQVCIVTRDARIFPADFPHPANGLDQRFVAELETDQTALRIAGGMMSEVQTVAGSDFKIHGHILKNPKSI